MSAFIVRIRKFLGFKSTQEGATMVEYGLMVSLIAVVCLLAVTALGVNIQAVFTQIAGAM